MKVCRENPAFSISKARLEEHQETVETAGYHSSGREREREREIKRGQTEQR